MATKEQMEKVKDIVVKLRYLECMDNIIYYDRWNNCPKDGFDYEGKVGAYLTEMCIRYRGNCTVDASDSFSAVRRIIKRRFQKRLDI